MKIFDIYLTGGHSINGIGLTNEACEQLANSIGNGASVTCKLENGKDCIINTNQLIMVVEQ